MKRMSGRLSFALTLLTVLGLAHRCPALAEAPPKEMVPFKATISGGLPDMFVLPLEPPVIFSRVSATGQATELGAFTYLESHVAHLDTEGMVRAITDVFGVMTGANGDAIFIRLSGLAQPTTTPPGLTAQLAYTVAGGKGRFQGATGSGVVHAVLDADKKTMVCVLEGTLSRPR
jgi:hypothetical protein